MKDTWSVICWMVSVKPAKSLFSMLGILLADPMQLRV